MPETPAAPPFTPHADLDAETLELARAAFTQALPRIHRLAHAFHGRLRGDSHDEAVSETEAFAWKAFRDLAAQGPRSVCR